MATKKKELSFEQSLADLEALVSKMEQGDLSLNESLTAFEQGVQLTRECQTMLDQAQQKVQVLTEKNGELIETPFESEI